MYFGLILTEQGPKVIEYNCRFGDPETQVVLPLLKTDLFTIMRAVRDEHLSELDIQWSTGAAACVVLASGGYPKKYETGFPIEGLDEDGGTSRRDRLSCGHQKAGRKIFNRRRPGAGRDRTGRQSAAGAGESVMTR